MQRELVSTTFFIGYSDHTWVEDTREIEINGERSMPNDPEFGWDYNEFIEEAQFRFLSKHVEDHKKANRSNGASIRFVGVLDFDTDKLLAEYPEPEDE